MHLRMPSPANIATLTRGRLRLFATLLSVASLLSLLAGAAALRTPGVDAAGTMRTASRVTGPVTGVLTLVLAIGIFLWDRRAGFRLAALGSVLSVGLLGYLGMMAARGEISPGLAVLFACLGHAFFALAMLLAKLYSNSWSETMSVPDGGVPPLRILAALAFPLAVTQIALGSAYRQSIIGLLPHVVGAILVGLYLIIVGFFAMTQFASHPRLRGVGIHLLSIVATQILLGVGAYSVRAAFDTTPPVWGTVLILVHVATGAMVLAATATFTAAVFREVRPKNELSYHPASAGSKI